MEKEEKEEISRSSSSRSLRLEVSPVSRELVSVCCDPEEDDDRESGSIELR